MSRSKKLALEVGRFLLMSGVSFLLSVGGTSLMVEVLGVHPEVAFAVALCTVFFTSFLMMRYIVFPSREESFIRQLALYTPAAAGFRGAEYLAFLVLHTWLQLHYQAVVLAVLVTSAVTKFIFYRAIVFRRTVAAP